MSTTDAPHRADRGSASLRIDPYAVEDVTFTLEEYRRQQAMAQHPSTPRRDRTARRRRTAARAA